MPTANMRSRTPSCQGRWPTRRSFMRVPGRRDACRFQWPLIVFLAAQPLASAMQESPQVFRTEAVGVVVDAVARDAHGHLLRCLAKSDFTIFEDGKEQQIQGFEIVGSATCDSAIQSPPERNRAAVHATTTPPVTAIVFEELGPDARAAAFRAAQAFVRDRRLDTEFVGVFTLDFALHPIVPYTRDDKPILEGIRRAATRPGCPESVTGIIMNADAGSGCSGALGEVKVKQTLAGLRMVVRTLALFPGRKNVLLFSEGFRVSTGESAVDRLEGLLEAANQRGVTFHAIDAVGLRAIDGRQDTRQRLSAYSGVQNGPGGLATTSQDPNTLLALDPTIALARLADGTGGEFVQDTNGLDAAVRQLAGEMHDYYRLNYRPTDQSTNRRYHRITVKVSVPGAIVRARSGYYAPGPGSKDLPTLQPSTVAPHLILDSGATPHDFTLTTALRKSKELEVHADVSAGDLTFNNVDGQFEAGVTILVRAIDSDKQVLAAASDSFALRGPAEELPASQARTVQFSKTLPLRNARTIELVAYDIFGQRAAVERYDANKIPR